MATFTEESFVDIIYFASSSLGSLNVRTDISYVHIYFAYMSPEEAEN